MPRISNLVPLPGVSELEALAQGFVSRLKDADLEYGKRAAVARRLERLVEHAKRPEAPAGLTSQLLEIQRQFQAADASSSRLGIRGAQRKLELWDELSARLDETMEVNMASQLKDPFGMADPRRQFDLLMHPHHTQTQTASISPREWKVKVVDSYEITNQVEIRREAVWKPAANLFVQPYEIVNTSLRAGRLGSLPVAYMTFAADSENTAHELVKQELKHISRPLHVNVAQLVGTTEGYNGLNGIIVVMEGIDFRRFDLQRRSGAVWAKCIRGFENFVASYPKSREVQRITVTPDGHVTMFPFDPIHPTGGAVPTQFRKYSADGGDTAVSLLFDIYRANCFPVMESELRLFVDSLVELGLAYTELRVMGLAKSFKLFPTPRYHSFGEDWEPIPPFQPGVGEFGWATYDNGRLKDWQSLGTSRYSNVMNQNRQAKFSDSLGLCEFPAFDGSGWITRTFHYPPNDYSDFSAYFWSKVREEIRGLSWEDILNEGRALSRRLNVDLDSISFCHEVSYITRLRRPENASWSEVPKPVYYHRKPSSHDPRHVEGFLSASKIPDSGEWEKNLRQRGWEVERAMTLTNYDMADDWGSRYERELQKAIATTPGSYPGAHIEEVL